MGARHLSQIQEESDSREHSSFVVRSGAAEAERQDAGSSSEAPNDQKKNLDDNRSLLEELTQIEAELRESVRLDVERQQEAEFLRQQENKLQRQNLCYLSLSQRVGKPWVSSYFRRFPMHIYCLPVQAANQKRRRRGQTRRKLS